MERLTRSLWVWVVAMMTGAVLMFAGCGGGAQDSGSGDTGGDVVPDLPFSDRCIDACESFMEHCGDISSATEFQCKLGCERNWSESVSTCVTEASSCGTVERCSEEGGDIRPDAGGPADGGMGDVSPDISPGDVSPEDISSGDVSPGDVSSEDASPGDVEQVDTVNGG